MINDSKTKILGHLDRSPSTDGRSGEIFRSRPIGGSVSRRTREQPMNLTYFGYKFHRGCSLAQDDCFIKNYIENRLSYMF